MKETNENDSEGNFDLSISDMMSALCFIFILVCAVLVFRLKKMSENYVTMQQALYSELKTEFETEIKEWNIDINDDLTITFKDPKVVFPGNSADLGPAYKKILDSFFPRLVKILSKPEYVDSIEELRIEGHTADASKNDSKEAKEIDYKEGMDLSQKRTREVLYYCLTTDFGAENDWVKNKIIAIGYSKSKPIIINDKIDWSASRRVEFRIKTNSDKGIKEFLVNEKY